jgi:hypothetical protein
VVQGHRGADQLGGVPGPVVASSVDPRQVGVRLVAGHLEPLVVPGPLDGREHLVGIGVLGQDLGPADRALVAVVVETGGGSAHLAFEHG